MDTLSHSHSNPKRYQWQAKCGSANVPEDAPFLYYLLLQLNKVLCKSFPSSSSLLPSSAERIFSSSPQKSISPLPQKSSSPLSKKPPSKHHLSCSWPATPQQKRTPLPDKKLLSNSQKNSSEYLPTGVSTPLHFQPTTRLTNHPTRKQHLAH